jgi:hypothetical protein
MRGSRTSSARVGLIRTGILIIRTGIPIIGTGIPMIRTGIPMIRIGILIIRTLTTPYDERFSNFYGPSFAQHLACSIERRAYLA